MTEVVVAVVVVAGAVTDIDTGFLFPTTTTEEEEEGG